MNNIALAGALVVVFALPLPAIAQSPATAPPAKQAPAAPPAAAPPAAAPAAAAEPAKPTKKVRHRVPSKADARVCLEFPTTMQIIKCSEKYRWAS
jgi:hypothetical protein